MSGKAAIPAPSPPVAARYPLTADRGDAGVRLDLVLLRHLGGPLALSRRRLQRAIEEGAVIVNGAAVTRTAARVACGDRIEAMLPALARREPPEPQDRPLEILFEDDHLLAVNKRPGIVVHPSYKHRDDTLLNALLWHCRQMPARPRLLNRLDKDTSGVLLVSKTRSAHAAIVKAARAGGVRKEYLAIVRGVPRPATGAIAMPLGRDAADSRRVVRRPIQGKASVTRYRTVSTGRLAGHTGAIRVSLVRCELVTGRMHQIRVHLAERGWPIVGDRVYGAGLPAGTVVRSTGAARAGGAGGAGRAGGTSASLPRQALHAWSTALVHPATGDRLVIVAPIPDDLRALMAAAGLDEREDGRRQTAGGGARGHRSEGGPTTTWSCFTRKAH